MKKKGVIGSFILLLVAFIWGAAFVTQSVGLKHVGSFTLNGARTVLGALTLLPIIVSKDILFYKKAPLYKIAQKKQTDKNTLIYGIVLGIVFCYATNVQQMALIYSPPGKVAFITAVYIFLVPIINLFLGKRAPIVTWISIAIGFLGLFLLSVDVSSLGAVNKGDLLAMGCSIGFAIHIVTVGKISNETDVIRLSATQFMVSGFVSLIIAFIAEKPNYDSIETVIFPLFYAGVFSCGIAYTLQIVGQKTVDASMASLLVSTESVFAVLTALVFLGDRLSLRETFGCIIMFIAITTPEIYQIIKSKRKTAVKE